MLQIDLFARADQDHYSVIGEVKNRDNKKFSLKEAQAFEKKLAVVKEEEKLDKAIGFLFSLSGFTKEAEKYCKKNHIAYSSDPQWWT